MPGHGTWPIAFLGRPSHNADHQVDHHAASCVNAMETAIPQIPPVVIITGSSRGIGRAVAVAFGCTGYRVGVHYRERAADAESVAQTITTVGGDALVCQGDVRDAGQMAKAIAAVLDRWQRLDVVVCNAGLALSQLVLRTSPDEWDRSVATNLTGVFHTMRAAAEEMIRRGGGHIIVLGSYAGLQGTTGQAAYAASKAGLVGLVRTAAQEWGPSNLRVNMVLPGWHHTDLSGDALPAAFTGSHTLGRSPELAEVARTIVHLASCRDVSGQIWNLDSRPLS